MSNQYALTLVPAVVVRPWLWLEAMRAGWAHRPRRGWRSLLPVPEERYWAWRMHTAFGDGPLVVDEVLAVLSWRRRMRRLR